MSTVAVWVSCSERQTSKSPCSSWMGRLAPSRRTRVHDRLLQVQVERIAELVGLRVLRPVDAAGPASATLVLAEAFLLELGVDLAQCRLSDLARASRRQLPGVAALADVAGVFQDLEELLQFLQRFGRFIAEKLLQLLHVDVFDVAAVLGALELALQLVHVLHVAHEAASPR